MLVYEIRNVLNDKVYVGATTMKLSLRWSAHKSLAKRGGGSAIHEAIHQLGVENFYIVAVKRCDDKSSLDACEIGLISFYKEIQTPLYNICKGGPSDGACRNPEAQRAKLRIKRAGRKPALGMSHTEENKARFSEFGKARWDKYGRYPQDIIHESFINANKKFGISKTHFYRLRKLEGINEPFRTFANQAGR